MPDGFRLSFDPLLGVENHDATIQNAQRSLHFRGEIDVAGRIDQIDGAVTPSERDARTVDGDAPVLLFGIVVGVGGAGVHLAQTMLGAGVIKEMIGRGRLAGVDVGDDPDIANLAQLRQRHG